MGMRKVEYTLQLTGESTEKPLERAAFYEGLTGKTPFVIL